MAEQPICEPSSLKNPRMSYVCGHCKEEVSKNVFQHRKLYYDKRSGEWKTERVTPNDLGKDFDFEEAEGATQGTA